jgi:hypothetical protein
VNNPRFSISLVHYFTGSLTCCFAFRNSIVTVLDLRQTQERDGIAAVPFFVDFVLAAGFIRLAGWLTLRRPEAGGLN